MPRCANKNCKEKFVPRYFLQKHCMEKDECIRAEIDLKTAQAWKKDKQILKVETHSKEYRSTFQNEVNKLSRMIDESFGFTNCIDCDKDLSGHQIDACHLISRKKNSSLRWNLHNLHSGHNHCNFYNERHESNYKKGLEKRYGKEYKEMVENLPIQFKEAKISNLEVFEKLKIVRGLIRHFNTYEFESATQARTSFNNIIGIYKVS